MNPKLPRPCLTAHRGSSGRAPENTLVAIQCAIEDQADYVEIDLQLSADNIPVLLHDENLSRLFGRAQSVHALTWAELQQLDAGAWFSPNYAGERIPALAAAVMACQGKIKLHLDVKPNPSAPWATVLSLLKDILVQHEMQEHCLLASIDPFILQQAQQLHLPIPLGVIVTTRALPSFVWNYNFLSLSALLLTKSLLQRAHALGKSVHVWTVNQPKDFLRLATWGVDDVITDQPALLRSYWDQSVLPTL